jgi:hypothetical protein
MSAKDLSVLGELGKARRAHNRAHSPDILKEFGFSFATKNNGAHIVVQVALGTVDFWPGTGLWEHRETRHRGRGVFKLVQEYQPHRKPAEVEQVGTGQTIKRTEHMSDFTVEAYRKAGFTVIL